MKFNKETIKKNIAGYLHDLDNDRKTFPEEDYVNSFPGFVYKGLFYLISIMIVFLLLMGNILEKNAMIQVQGSLSFIIFVLGFSYLTLKLIQTISIKRYLRDLGMLKDILRLTVYVIIIFILSTFTLVSVGTYTATDPIGLGEFETNIIKSMSNLTTVLDWLFYLGLISIVIRGVMLMSLKGRESGRRTRIRKDVEIKLKR